MKSIIVLIAASVAVAVAVQPGFDPKEVVRHVRGARAAGSHRAGVAPLYDWGEFLIDTTWAMGLAPEDEGSSSVAFDGTNYLIVWADRRNWSSDWDIYGARVSLEGSVLDADGICISAAVNTQGAPAVSFDGTNYLVVWVDERGGDDDIYGARVSQGGAVWDTAGVPISTAGSSGGTSVSFDGTNFLVAWTDYRNNPDMPDIYGARVSRSATVIDPGGFPISTAANGQQNPAVSFDGTNYLVVWEDGRGGAYIDIYGTRVSPEATVLDPTGIAISTAARFQYAPSATFDGTSFLVVWQDYRNGQESDIYGARVSQDGSLLDSSGIAVSLASDNQSSPGTAFDGTNFLVVWQDDRNGGYTTSDIYGARVTPGGTVLDPSGRGIARATNYQWSPSIGFGGANFMVAWTDWRHSPDPSDVYGVRVNQAGVALDPAGIPISTEVTSQSQWSPSVAFDGTNYLVVWQDDRCTSYVYDIYGARVSQDGTVLEPFGIPISTAPNSQSSPAVSFDGADYFVVWGDQRGGSSAAMYGTRVTPQGVVRDPDGIRISTRVGSQGSPAVAFDGTNSLVVWTEYGGEYGYDIYGARVSPGGSVMDSTGIAISTAPNDQGSPAVAFDGTHYLVVWRDCRNGGNDSSDIYGARVSQSGTVLDPSGIAISTAANVQNSPSVAFDGANSFVVWQDDRNGGYDRTDVYGARVSQSGTVLDPSGIAISTAANVQNSPSVAFDGAEFIVVWADYRNDLDTSDIYGARVSSAGGVLETFPVVTQPGYQFGPELRRGQGDQMFLAYEGWAGEVQGRWYNTTRIWGKLGPIPAVEEGPRPHASYFKSTATIVRGVLFLPRSAPDTRNSTLLDITGRKVAELVPGANDVSGFSPGVYFVRHEPSPVGRQPSAVTKVVIQ